MIKKRILIIIGLVFVNSLPGAEVSAARNAPFSLAMYPQNIVFRDTTGWGISSAVVAEFDSTEIAVHENYSQAGGRTTVYFHYTNRTVYANGWTLSSNNGNDCFKLVTPSRGRITTEETGLCNTESNKITSAVVYLNQYSIERDPDYISTPTWFKNFVYRHEAMHSIGFNHNVDVWYEWGGDCSPQSVINRSGCDRSDRSDTLTPNDYDLINQYY